MFSRCFAEWLARKPLLRSSSARSWIKNVWCLSSLLAFNAVNIHFPNYHNNWKLWLLPARSLTTTLHVHYAFWTLLCSHCILTLIRCVVRMRISEQKLVLISFRVARIYMSVSDRRRVSYPPHDWPNSYVYVTNGTDALYRRFRASDLKPCWLRLACLRKTAPIRQEKKSIFFLGEGAAVHRWKLAKSAIWQFDCP